jgi:argonaute-like protein implicated in RNA metabolism and viral defense
MISFAGAKIKDEPHLLFDKSDSSAAHQQIYWGLKAFGPYDKDRPDIKLGIVCPEDKKKAMDGLIRGLNEGTGVIPGGMPQFFRCKTITVKEVTTKSTDVEEYEQKANEFIKSTDYKNVDVVLVFIPKTSRYFSNTPYYRLKAIFTASGYVTQMITQATFDNIKWAYLNLASAIFSKAGGIPWVLQSEMKNTDMILGISVSNLVTYKMRAGGAPRFAGCVNVFDNYGKWMFFEGTANLYDEDRGSRAEQLKELLKGCIEKFKAIKKGQLPNKIVIHYFKKFSQEEIETTDKLLTEIVGDHRLACVSVNSSHPFRAYDKTTSDGSFSRGSYIYFRPDEALLSTTGETPIAGLRMGTPKLLHIRLRQTPSDFLTIDDAVHQVFSLTKLNWATSMPMMREPVTLEFSKAIAYLTAVISEQQWRGITSSQISPMLSNRPWFI